MKPRKILVFLLLLFAFLLQACGPNVEAAIATAIAQTQQISALETAAAGGGGGAQVQPTITETTSPGLAFVSVSQNTNCRSGPRADYILLTTINIGQQVEVLKTFSDEYVLVKNPNGAGDCWLFLRYADNVDFSAFNLEIATQPPTPTPTNTPKPTDKPAPSFDWSGTWTFYLGKAIDLGVSGNVDQSGDQISGSFATAETFYASLSDNWQVATGTWQRPSSNNITFVWQINASNSNQFVGHYVRADGTFGEWCGSRGGAPKPNPCLGP